MIKIIDILVVMALWIVIMEWAVRRPVKRCCDCINNGMHEYCGYDVCQDYQIIKSNRGD